MAGGDLSDRVATMVLTRWQLEVNTDTRGIKKNRQDIEVTHDSSIHTVNCKWICNDTHIHTDDRGVDSISVCLTGVTHCRHTATHHPLCIADQDQRLHHVERLVEADWGCVSVTCMRRHSIFSS